MIYLFNFPFFCRRVTTKIGEESGSEESSSSSTTQDATSIQKRTKLKLLHVRWKDEEMQRKKELSVHDAAKDKKYKGNFFGGTARSIS